MNSYIVGASHWTLMVVLKLSQISPFLTLCPLLNFKSLISRYFYYFHPNFLRLSVTIARLVKTYLPDGMSSHSLGDGRWMSCPDVDKPESEHDFCKSFERTLLEVNSS